MLKYDVILDWLRKPIRRTLSRPRDKCWGRLWSILFSYEPITDRWRSICNEWLAHVTVSTSCTDSPAKPLRTPKWKAEISTASYYESSISTPQNVMWAPNYVWKWRIWGLHAVSCDLCYLPSTFTSQSSTTWDWYCQSQSSCVTVSEVHRQL
jgi:hypothetical protein